MLIVLILVFIAAVSCTTKYGNMQSFETVWQTINDKLYDPTFGGLDWNEVYDRYQPQITKIEKSEEFYIIVNKMLFGLNLSHTGVVPWDNLHQVEPTLSAKGSIGIDIRMLESNALITSVKSDSSGGRAGLRAGYIIKSIDGIKIDQITDIKHINIGYVRFNAFVPPVDQKFIKAIDSMDDTSGLIIHIRGNPGGFFPVRKALADKMVKNRMLFWSYRERNQTRDVYLDPSKNPYSGPVVILIDALSRSSSEELPGGMKAIQRATIFGERSPGCVLVMKWLKLLNGGVLFYPYGQTRTADGTILEGNGVMPDISVKLDRNVLTSEV